jgi:hypothetical protein
MIRKLRDDWTCEHGPSVRGVNFTTGFFPTAVRPFRWRAAMLGNDVAALF